MSHPEDANNRSAIRVRLHRLFLPTGYEDVDEATGAIETREEEACAIKPPSRVATGLPDELGNRFRQNMFPRLIG